MTKQQWAVLAVILGLGALAAFPLSNLMAPRQSDESRQLLSQLKNPAFKPVASVMESKCLDCHSSLTQMPFYSDFPVAKQIITEDIESGIHQFDIIELLLKNDGHANDTVLAKVEAVVNDDSMPPLRYRALHWDAGLTDADRKLIRAWIAGERRQLAGPGVHPDFRNEPVRPVVVPTDLNPQKIALGEKLYNDTRLSGDNTLSCASCHDLKKGGTDQVAVSTGIRGQKGPINSPTVFNSGHNFVQFWDGRAKDLKEQAAGPVENPIEMGAQWPEVLAKLAKDVAYQRDFRRVYGDGVTKDNVTDAIAEFEKTLVTPNSRFDQYLAGKPDALTPLEKQGYDAFKKNGCATCHAGPNLGGQTYQKMGAKKEYFSMRGNVVEVDMGRYNVSKAARDRHYFKVPTLRNIALTQPYFHDAATGDLKEAVRMMGQYQRNQTLSDADVDAITAFLHTLTGEYQGKPLSEK